MPAEADIQTAYEYIRDLSHSRAETWLNELFQAIFTLEEMPARCPLIPETEEIGQPLRHLLYGKRTGTYRIIFDIQEEAVGGPLVRVLRIWHGAREEIKSSDIEAED